MKNPLENFLDIKIEYMEPTTELEQVIESKFLTPAKFAQEIESLVASEHVNYIDAIVMYCEDHKLEVESVAKLVTKTLKERLKNDAINLNFMKRSSKARLPF